MDDQYYYNQPNVLASGRWVDGPVRHESIVPIARTRTAASDYYSRPGVRATLIQGWKVEVRIHFAYVRDGKSLVAFFKHHRAMLVHFVSGLPELKYTYTPQEQAAIHKLCRPFCYSVK